MVIDAPAQVRRPSFFRASFAMSAGAIEQEVALGAPPIGCELESSETCWAKKQRRFLVGEPGLDGLGPISRAKFLDFHVDVLHSIYRRNVGGASAAVDDSVWETIKAFLQLRDQLVLAKQEAACMQGIHNEAMRYLEAGLPPNNPAAPSPGSSPRPNTDPRMNLKSSPVYPHSTFLSQNTVSSPPNVASTSSNNQFHIVGRLLGRRSKIVESSFQQLANPFQPLLQSTSARILSLQQELREMQQSLRSQDQRRMRNLVDGNVYKSKPATQHNDFTEEQQSAERSCVADMECKIRLWSLLADDLRGAISPVAST